MASCRLTRGYKLGCAFTIGGISNIYLADMAEIESWTEDTDGSYTAVAFKEYDITDITNADPAVVTAAGHPFEVGEYVFITGTTAMTGGIVGQHVVGAVTSTTFELADLDTTTSGAFGASVLVASSGFYEIEITQDAASNAAPLTKSNGNNFFTQTITTQIASANNSTQELVRQLVLSKVVAAVKWNDGLTKINFDELGGQATAADLSSGTAFGDFAGITLTLTGASTHMFRLFDGTLPIFENLS